jgi:hypothetical protein
VSSDLVKGGVARFGSTDGGYGSIKVRVGVVMQQFFAGCPFLDLEFQSGSIGNVRDDDMVWEGGIAGWGNIDSVDSLVDETFVVVELRHWMKMVWATGTKTK